MTNSNIRYVLYYPASRIGGAQLLFARIAEALIAGGMEVLVLIENEQDFINKYLREKKLNFKSSRTSKSNKFKLKEDDLLVLSLSYLTLFDQYIHPHKDSRLVFWDLHPYALIEATALSKIHKDLPYSWISKLSKIIEYSLIKKIRAFVTIANDHEAIYFMCSRNFNTNKEHFTLEIQPNYLPIPITLEKKVEAKIRCVHKTKMANPNFLRIGWISRMDTDKVSILELLIEDIKQFNKSNQDLKIQLHAIGQGNVFDKLLDEQTIMGDMLKLPGVLSGPELDTYVYNNIDLGFSMGTSALEFAKREVATILVPSVTRYKLFKSEKRRYLWLHNSFGFDLAVERLYLNNSSKTFENIVTEFRNESDLLAKKTHEYLIKNHSLSNILEKFLNLSSRSTLTYSSLAKIGVSSNRFFQNSLFCLKKNIKKIKKRELYLFHN